MIGFFKNLFNGIVSFFTGIFSSKKSQEKPSSTSPVEKLTEATSASVEKLTEATSASVEKLTEATSASVEKLTEATAKTTSGIQSSLTGLVGGKTSEENKPSTKAATAKKQKRSGYFMELNEDEEKSANNKQSTQAKAKTSQPVAAAKNQKAKVDLVQTAEGVKAEPAKPTKTPAASASSQNQTETTFAPKYLIPSASSNSRRRPGPSMNPFLDMARQVKTPG